MAAKRLNVLEISYQLWTCQVAASIFKHGKITR